MRTPFLRPRHKVKKPVLHRATIDPDQMDRSIIAHAYVNNIVDGRGDVSMFLTLAFRLLLGMELTAYVAEQQKAVRVLRASLGSLWFMGERIIKKHKVGFSGNELRNITAALALVDEVAKYVQPTEYRLCCSNVSMRVGGINLTLHSLEQYKEHA